MSKLRVGIVGGGGIAGAHLPRLNERSDAVEVVGVSDLDVAIAAATAEKYGISRHVKDFHDFLGDVDAVVICVPTLFHAEIAIDALNAGKHVFCEKPMARSLEQADAMIAAAQKSGATIQIGFVRQFDDEWMAFRTAVQAGKIGRPVTWRDVQASAGPRQWSDRGGWFTNEEIGGGPFLDGCIHNIDFALSTFGPAEWVFAHARTIHKDSTALDTGTATVHFKAGDELMLAWCWGLPKDCSGARAFDLFGPQGVLNWPAAQPADATERTMVINHGAAQEIVSFPANAIALAFERQMDEFIEVARGQKQPRAGGAEGRSALQVALAILKSGRSRQVVEL
ncbi:MAG TPA: Gfo/Idh/MocA family oxidoreductase [Abditibacteriaceae bacterium]|nr:Gfo/Idh/MocA family oxidoreductase [Abditibacteriaceae bacterium]